MSASPALLAATISSALIFGLVVSLVGCLRSHWKEHLKIEEAQATGLWAGLHWGMIPLMLLGGILVDIWGLRGALWLGGLLTSLSFFLLCLCERLKTTRYTLILMSGGVALLGVGSLVAMPYAFFGQEEAAAALNLGTANYVLGALLAPVLGDVVLRLFGFRRLFILVAILALVPAIIAIGIGKQSPIPTPELISTASRETFDILLDPLILAAAVALFVYAPIEGTVSRWGTAYFVDLGHDTKGARLLLSGFWSCFLASRLLTASLLHLRSLRVLPASWDPWVLVFCTFLALIILGNLMGTARITAAGIGFLLLGFCLGPVFPTIVGLLFSELPGRQGTAFGAMFCLGSLGGVLLGPLISADAKRAASAQRVLRFPLILGLGLMISSIVLTLLLRSSY